MRPLKTGRRLIRFWERSAMGWSGWAELAAAMEPSSAVETGQKTGNVVLTVSRDRTESRPAPGNRAP